MIEIDASHGGGQIIRTSLAMSTITNQSFKATGIRKNRPKPGLKNQHLACIEALEKLSGAKAKNATPGLTEIEFLPGKIIPQTISIDIGTAGSITLLMQALLLPCCLADGKVRLKIIGGTDVKWSMSIDYFLNIILPHYMQLADFKINELTRGFYPKGQGLLDITIKPKNKTMPKLALTKKLPFSKVKGISSASQELREADVVARQANAAKKKLQSLDVPIKIIEEYTKSASVGTVITLWANTNPHVIGSDALGEVRKRAEAVGAEAGADLLYLLCSDAVVDTHLADNLIPLLGLFGGEILTDEISGHIKSNIYTCKKFLGIKYDIDDRVISAQNKDIK